MKDNENIKTINDLSPNELNFLKAYRKNPELQEKVRRILNVKDPSEEEQKKLQAAAQSKEF